MIRVENAGEPDESLKCEGCGAVVRISRTDPKRWGWVFEHVMHEGKPKRDPKAEGGK